MNGKPNNCDCFSHTLIPLGREYRFQTFTLPRHPTRLYLYSLDACKMLGFRDTYIFFLRNENVKRVNGTEEDRECM